jgi:hypothetical protein
LTQIEKRGFGKTILRDGALSIRISIKPLSKVFGSPTCGGVRLIGFGTRFSEALQNFELPIEIGRKTF